MTDTITIEKINEVYIRIRGEPHIEQELHDYFQFDVDAAKFMKDKNGKRTKWNGKIFLYSKRHRTLYAGLLEQVKFFCSERNIVIKYLSDFSSIEFSVTDAEKFINYIKPPFIPRDYQLGAFINCVRNHRALMLMPTASGKSFTIYLLSRLYTINSASKRKFLIIVPSIGLVHQMANDLISYGADPDTLHRITGGVTKVTDKPIIISTWQSLVNLPDEWFNQIKTVVVDEVHEAKAKSIKGIMERMPNTKYRFGFTGTLDNVHCNRLVIEGLTGPVKRDVSTKDLIDRGDLAELRTKILTLKYTDEERSKVIKMDYADEMDFLVRNEARNKFIKNLTLSLDGNRLVLFQYVDKHGKILYDMLKDAGVPCYFIHGGVDGEEREEIRNIVMKNDKAIIIASYGTFQRGVNIPNINYIIAASPTKSKVRLLQSIGRGLRLTDGKTFVGFFDIADDLSYKGKRNFTLDHLFERIKEYNAEKFTYKLYEIQLSRESIADKTVFG